MVNHAAKRIRKFIRCDLGAERPKIVSQLRFKKEMNFAHISFFKGYLEVVVPRSAYCLGHYQQIHML
jgi:hypothetical protein